LVTSLCFETPVVTASTLLEDSFFEKTESIVVLQTTKYVSEDVSVSCLRSIRIQTEGETDRLIVDIKPIYLEYLSDKLTVASPISIDHDLVHTYELSLNHETKLAKLTFPERILTPEYSHGYLFAQSAFAILIAWGLKEAPEYRFLCLAWETDRHNIDWEPVFRSLGFRITHFSIGKTVYGVCESAHLKSLLERDTSEYIRKINAQGFIWSLKRDCPKISWTPV